MSSSSPVPVIDITDLRSDDEASRRAVGKEIDAACREIGFFSITGHGVPDELIAGVYDTAKEFFALPLEEKRRVAQPDPKTVRGYTAIGEQAFAYNDDTSAPGDLHEKFDVGPHVVSDDPYFAIENAGPHFIPNQWPERPAGMQQAWERYFEAADDLSRLLMRGFALGLDLPEDFFEDNGWWAGPAAWALCALITATALRLPRGAALVGAALAGIPSLLALPLGLHWLGALLAVVVFAAWCGRLARDRRLTARAI